MRVVSLSIAASVAFAFAAAAQDSSSHRHDNDSDGTRNVGHAENHDWYRELKQPGTGYSCCNGTVNGVEGDCRPTRAYLTDEGQWRALIDGKWVLVPPRAVLKQLAPDGRSHVCASRSGVIYCF